MAVHLGGVYSKPSGKAGGIVWGRARTLLGKMATSREYVIPTDPNTADQQDERELFAVCVAVASLMGTAIWQSAWNNTLGELPGYHSFMGWMRDSVSMVVGIPNMDDPPASKSLGPAFMPSVTSAGGAAGGQIKLTWDETCHGDHCDLTDDVMGLVLLQARPHTVSAYEILLPGSITRDDEEWQTAGDAPPAENVAYAMWFRHDPGGGEPLEYSPIATGIRTTTA